MNPAALQEWSEYLAERDDRAAAVEYYLAELVMIVGRLAGIEDVETLIRPTWEERQKGAVAANEVHVSAEQAFNLLRASMQGIAQNG